MSMLARILARKRLEVSRLAQQPLPIPPARRPVELARAAGQPLRLIAEIKRRSPSAGALDCTLSPAERGARYEAAGAHMISVLTDETFFDGAFAHLTEVRAATTVPLLCKEFVIDERQLDAARAHGADAVLLIVRCLDGARLATLVAAAHARDLVPLVEIANEREARLALDAGAELIGVNARDLDTLAMNPALAQAVLASLPKTVTRVHLSGLATPRDVRAIASGPADAALVGEALMRQADPAPLLDALVRAG